MADILIKNIDCIVTMDDAKEILCGCDILIKGNRIEAIGKDLQGEDCRIIDGSGRIAIPGLINTHHHFFQTIVRNIPELNYGLTLEEWLDANYGVYQHIDEEALYNSSFPALIGLMKSGCTTTVDHHYVFTSRNNSILDSEILAAAETGMRFMACRGSISIGKSQGNYVPDTMAQSLDDIIYDSERLIRKYHDSSPGAMTRIALAPCNNRLDSTSDVLAATLELARKHGVRLHTHLAESPGETEIALSRFGKRPFELMEDAGWLGPDVWFAHCTQLNSHEIKVLADSGTGIAHCPVSNMQTGVVAPVPEMLSCGVPVGFAVDGSGSNNTSDMLMDMHICYNVHALNSLDTSLTSYDVLYMATRGSANVLGWADDIGSLEPGKCADIVLLDWSKPEYAGGINDPIECIVMCGNSSMVDKVFINGELRVSSGHIEDIDEHAVSERVNRFAADWLRKNREGL